MEVPEIESTNRDRPVMADVAKAAGVALGTVSNVLNHPDRVSEKTRARVLAAIADLGFIGNSVARSLATGRLDAVGFVTVDLANSFFLNIARGAEQALDKHRMHLLLANSDVDPIKQSRHLNIFEQIRVSGILLAPLDGPIDVANTTQSRGTPVVYANWPGTTEACGVVVDEKAGGFIAAEHLLKQGCRRLVFAGGPYSLTAVSQRLDGARHAVKQCPGAKIEQIETDGLTIRAGHGLGRQFLSMGKKLPDGVVSASDSLAAGAIQTLAIAGIAVPDRIAFVGYDNNHFAYDNVIPITSVGQPGHGMGRIAVEQLMDEIDSPGHNHKTVMVEPALHVRDSSRWGGATGNR